MRRRVPVDAGARRSLLLAGMALLAGRTAPARAQRLLSQHEAAYQDTPKGVQMCGTCTMFVRPNACKVVEGEVQRTGWCRLYDMTD